MRDKKRLKILNIIARLSLTAALLGAATAVGYVFRRLGFPETNEVLVYLLAVLLTARLTDGFSFGLLASLGATFAYNFFFIAPYYTLRVHDPSYLVTFAIMTVTALITSAVTSHAKKSAREARDKEAETMAVYKLTNRLTEAGSLDEINDIALGAIGETFSCKPELLDVAGGQAPDSRFIRPVYASTSLPGKAPDFMERRSSFVRLQDGVYADDENWPILGRDSLLGIIRIPREQARNMSEAQRRLMRSMAESIALATERLRASEQSAKTRELAERERYRANLLRAISHDLRTPLSGMIGTSEMLMSMTDKSDGRYALAAGIHEDAEWLHTMVDNIMSLTRLQDGKLVLSKLPEAAEEVIDDAVSHVARFSGRKNITPKTPDELLIVPMDAKLISQVLINLLDNAVKHTAPEDEITVTAEAVPPNAVFTVRDGGTGIKETDLPHIFEQFYTTNRKISDSGRGVGLGLAICETIVKAHGGTITARNRTDRRGAEFTFTLPLEDKNG